MDDLIINRDIQRFRSYARDLAALAAFPETMSEQELQAIAKLLAFCGKGIKALEASRPSKLVRDYAHAAAKAIGEGA